jgi:alpha-L-fucosidase 2
MLLQSHLGEIHLLPALPDAWPNGHVQGLRARSGFEIDIFWKNGTLSNASIKSIAGDACIVRYEQQVVSHQCKIGDVIQLDHELNRI